MDAFQKIYPSEFYRKFLVQNVRPDGRTLMKVRKTTVSVGSVTSADASAFVKIGHTSVAAGIRCEVGNPPVQDQQQIVVNVELSPLCSSKFMPGKPSEQAFVLTEHLNSLVKSAGLVTPSDLHFDQDGKVVWYLYVDIYCLDFDGNIFDASLIALIAALKTVQLPKGLINEKSEVLARRDKPKRQLRLQHMLVPLTFAILDEFVLADPTIEEEQLQSGSLTIVYNTTGKICNVFKPGGSVLPEVQELECFSRASERVHEVIMLIDKACKPETA